MNATKAVSVFNFNSAAVRTVDRDGQVWFSASDVCDALGVKNHRESIRHLDDDEKGVISNDTLGGEQQISVVNESGLYALVLRSRKPEARKFAKWVTSEVLPAIRKTGSYTAPALPHYITPAQQNALQQIVAQKSGESGGLRAYCWSRFNNHFHLGSYKQLPAIHFDEAMAYLYAMPMKQQALPAPSRTRLLITMQDGETRTQTIPDSASVFDDEDILKYISVGMGSKIASLEFVAEIFKACADRLAAESRKLRLVA